MRRKMNFNKKVLIVLLSVGLTFQVSKASISLVADTNTPEPNQEITVYIQSDTPLFAMGIGISISGDANIAGAMDTADCNQYGWDPGWNSDWFIDDFGLIYVSGVAWPNEANGIIGYIKFRYNSGQVSVSISPDDSDVFDVNWEPVEISYDPLIFGEPDFNNNNQQNESSQEMTADENTPAEDTNTYYDTNLPQNDNKNMSNNYNMSQMDEEPNTIEINTDINTPTIWTSNNIYWVRDYINIKSLLVIEPGTLVEFSGCDAGLIVCDGGCLISRGVTYTLVFDLASPSSYDWFYFSAIYVTSTASPATKIEYNYIEYAVEGIRVDDIKLDTPIQNNVLFCNYFGIVLFGTHFTDVKNNLCIMNFYAGIDIDMKNTQGIADGNSYVIVANNTCDEYYSEEFPCEDYGSSDNGIKIHGTADANNLGTVEIINNILADAWPNEINPAPSGYGLNICPVEEGNDKDVICYATNNGFYNNYENCDWQFPPDNNEIEVNDWPFVDGEYVDECCYLDQNCPFINAGFGYVEETPMIGMTTDFYWWPDEGVTDIGYHHSNWDFSNAGLTSLDADLNNDGVVDFKDLKIFSEYWLNPYNFEDFSVLASEWKQTTTQVSPPDISPTFNKDPNNLSGYINLQFDSILDPRICRLFLFMDGVKYCEIADFENPSTGLQTNRYANGEHSFKVVCEDVNGEIICSQPVDVNFNNSLHDFTMSDDFVPDENFYVYALADGNYCIEVNDIFNNNQTVYTGSFQNGINAHLNSNLFSDLYGLYNVTATKINGPGAGESFSEDISRKFRIGDYIADSNSKMVVSIGSSDLENYKERSWQAALKAGRDKGFNPILLRYNDCTWDNLNYCLHLGNVKIWYHCAHGNYQLLLQPVRQCIESADGWIFSNLRKDYNPVPPGYQSLSWYYENNHHSIAELGFWNTHKLIWAQFDACYSGHTLEFPYYLGMYQGQWPGEPIGNKIFIGWKNSAYASDILMKYNQFEENYWKWLSQGYMLEDAVMDSLPPVGGTNILENFVYKGVIDWQYVWFRYPNIN